MTPRSLWALDVLIEEGYRYDASIFPIHHDRYGIPVSPRHPYVLNADARRARRSAGLDGPLRPVQPADRRRRLFPDPAVRLDAVGHRRLNRVESSCRRSSICIRGRSIRISRGWARRRSGRFRHYRNLARTESRLQGAAPRLPLRADDDVAARTTARRGRSGRGAAALRLVDMPLRAASIAIADRVLDVTSDVPERDWDEFVASRPEASGYHVWRWRRVFESAFGHETRYLAAHEDGRIVGVLPLVIIRSRLFGRCAVSLPFVNYGGVCAEDDEVAACLVRSGRGDRERQGTGARRASPPEPAVSVAARARAQGRDVSDARTRGRARLGIDSTRRFAIRCGKPRRAV